ncbi:hypothetical protein [Acetatifactor aquisgranensis]|uniref:hypothetical protein n=1 Tax=Acetatifactor aquisgranensis TaxID=2941233 RepID=UPI0020416C90|nr:hypothetical protein [Acetatifactor aquisgranensis]MCI9650298.1 hypothetical protein [Lachnospiraceae bacterium]
MESEKIQTFINYLDQRTSSVQEDTLRLIADNRRDEANFEKIRTNIFQIVKTIFQASVRVSQEESERVRFLDTKLTLFQETWESYLTEAKEHGDDLKIVQEQTRLEALAEIRDTFQKIWGESL